MNDDEQPIELWNIEGRLTPMRYGPRAALDQLLDRCSRQQAEAENKRLRAELVYKQVIERFNRAHGQNRKITLKQICAEMGVSYGAVRQYRSRERKPKNKK